MGGWPTVRLVVSWRKMVEDKEPERGTRSGMDSHCMGVTTSKSKGSETKLLTSQGCDLCLFFCINPALSDTPSLSPLRNQAVSEQGLGLICHLTPLPHACTPFFPLNSFILKHS